MSQDPNAPEWLFDAILHPHRSLSRRGFQIFMAALGLLSLFVGLLFVANGAWPILGFYGLEVLIIYIALKANYRQGLVYEKVRLSETTLLVERGNLRGHREVFNFQPFWARVHVIDPTDHASRVVISSHGRGVTVGTFLSPEERLDFAKALTAALEFQRHPGRLFPPGGAAGAAAPAE